MPLADIREQIAAILASVDGVGVVHQYQRWSADWQRFLDLFKHEDADGIERINGCMLTRERTAQRKETLGEKELAHVFVVRWVYGLNDREGTELVFQAMLERGREAFNADETLGDTCRSTIPDWGPMAGLAGLQIEVVEPRMFGNVLCHYAECRLGVLEGEED